MHDGLAYLKKTLYFFLLDSMSLHPDLVTPEPVFFGKKIKPEKTRHNPTLFPFSAGGPVPNAVIPGFVPPHEQESIR
jgi:hypothetical protein